MGKSDGSRKVFEPSSARAGGPQSAPLLTEGGVAWRPQGGPAGLSLPWEWPEFQAKELLVSLPCIFLHPRVFPLDRGGVFSKHPDCV